VETVVVGAGVAGVDDPVVVAGAGGGAAPVRGSEVGVVVGGAATGGGVVTVVVGTVAVLATVGFVVVAVGSAVLATVGLASGFDAVVFAACVAACVTLVCALVTGAVPLRVVWVAVTELGVIESEAACVGEDTAETVPVPGCVVGVERGFETWRTGLNAAAAWTDAGAVVSGTSRAVWPPERRRWPGRTASTASAEAKSAPATRYVFTCSPSLPTTPPTMGLSAGTRHT
jgi:hypothetical protein